MLPLAVEPLVAPIELLELGEFMRELLDELGALFMEPLGAWFGVASFADCGVVDVSAADTAIAAPPRMAATATANFFDDFISGTPQ
jgi:hypothetical protein